MKKFFPSNSETLFDMSQIRFSIFSEDIFGNLYLSRKFSILSKMSNLLALIFFQRIFLIILLIICRSESNFIANFGDLCFLPFVLRREGAVKKL